MIFIDLEKAYGKVPTDLTWWVLDRRVPRGYVNIIKDIYEEAIMTVRTTCGERCEYSMIIGLLQGFSFKPLPLYIDYK